MANHLLGANLRHANNAPTGHICPTYLHFSSNTKPMGGLCLPISREHVSRILCLVSRIGNRPNAPGQSSSANSTDFKHPMGSRFAFGRHYIPHNVGIHHRYFTLSYRDPSEEQANRLTV